jgi:hypothetical protein
MVVKERGHARRYTVHTTIEIRGSSKKFATGIERRNQLTCNPIDRIGLKG